ncbi:MAG: ATP-binding protein, partial [Longimicrobiales bacterium]
MGETRVDLHHLLEDLRDAYPWSLEETILTEIIANSLDSGATRIELRADAPSSSLTVVDDGRGMVRRELTRYHDLAATTKTRGRGIGFAGVGIKLGLLACTEVITETRRGKSHVASSWQLASRHRAPWNWVRPAMGVGEHGTAVTLQFGNALTELLDPGYIEAAIARHFQPLLDPAFDDILAAQYPRGIAFFVNGRGVARSPADSTRAPLTIRIGRKRKPAAIGYLVRRAEPFPEETRGVAVSTLGKVIKRGWDWLGVTPLAPERISGLVEVPALAECLTLNKADFIRTGQRGATYLAYRKAVQEAVSAQLAEWGDAPDDSQ